MVSIIVPVYNVEQYLKKCVLSILEQSFQMFEIILVDDGSTDSSGALCDELAELDDRIQVIHQKNKGLSGARNTGLKRATGEFITYLDSDDSLHKNCLEILYKNAVQYNAAVSVCNYRLVWEQKEEENPSKEKEYQAHVYTGREAACKIVKENSRFMITAWGKLYRRELIPLLEYPEGKTHEDEFVTYRILYSVEKVVVSEQPLYLYLQRGNSIMNGGYGVKRLDKLIALKDAIAYFQGEYDADLERFARKRYLLNIQIAWYRVFKFMPDRQDLLEALRNEWTKNYKNNKKEMYKCSNLVDKFSMIVFRVSPKGYGLLSGVYLKLFPEV